MPNLLGKLYWHGANQVKSGPSPSEQLVDRENGDAVLEFTYRYLEAHSRPPSDDEVYNVTAAIARYQGPRVVPWPALELFLAWAALELFVAKLLPRRSFRRSTLPAAGPSGGKGSTERSRRQPARQAPAYGLQQPSGHDARRGASIATHGPIAPREADSALRRLTTTEAERYVHPAVAAAAARGRGDPVAAAMSPYQNRLRLEWVGCGRRQLAAQEQPYGGTSDSDRSMGRIDPEQLIKRRLLGDLVSG